MPEQSVAVDDGRLIIAAYWMLSTESKGCLGGMESDEMGYGKIYYLCSVSGQMVIIVFRL